MNQAQLAITFRNLTVALALVVLSVAATEVLWQWVAGSRSLLPLAAIALAGWVTSRGAAAAAAVAAALLGEYFLQEPNGFYWSNDDPIRLAVYIGVALLVSRLAHLRDRAVAAGQRARNHLLMITEALPVLIAYVDRHERYQFVNSAFAEWFNRPRAEIRGKTIRELAGEEVYTQIREHLQQAFRGELTSYERELTFPDGRRRTVLATYVPELDPDGRVQGIAILVADVSERRRAEAAVRASEEKFHVMADHAPVMIWMAGLDARATWFNRPWLEFAGRTLQQEIGDGWLERIHPDDRARFDETYARAFAAREPLKTEYRLRRHDGEYRWLLDEGRPLAGPEGEFAGYIGSCVDITERKRHEEEREHLLAGERYARGEAERVSRLKDQFLATLSHELRTPLNGILGWAQVLRGSLDDPEEVAQGLEIIERNARVQTQIISDLLDMSRIISGKLALNVREVDLAMLLHGCVQTVQHSADGKEIRIERAIDHGLGAIVADTGRLQQVMFNLLNNAIKFTPRGGRVRLEARRDDNQVHISVIDSGAGIDPEFLPHVFERFRQADASTTRKFGGLGLGLSIAKSLIELHGGTIEAHSEGGGKGARFDITLPVSGVEGEAEPELEGRAFTGERSEGLKLEGVRVLVIDDEPDARELVKRLLSEHGAVVQTAEDAARGLELLAQTPFDVLLSDIGMPDCDGFDLISRIRAGAVPGCTRIPAAAITAFARSEDRTRALLSGYQGFIAKPFEPSELLAVVASLSGSLRTDRPSPEPTEEVKG